MSKYGFDLKDLVAKQRAMLDILETNKCSDEEFGKAYELCDLYTFLISMFTGDDINNNLSSHEIFLAIKNDFNVNDFCKDKNTMFSISNILANLCPSKKREFNFSTINMSDDDSVNIVSDMVKCKFGNKHFNAFKSFFLECPNHIEFSPYYSSFMTLIHEERYVVIQDSDNISKIVNLGHEAGHISASLLSKNYDIYANSVLSEVESTFYELLLYDFLIEENIYKKDAITSMVADCDTLEKAGFIINLALNNALSKVKDVKGFNKLAQELNLFNSLNSSGSKDLLQLILDIYDDGFVYIYSRLVAIEFYYKYKNAGNPFGIIDQFDEFVNCVGVVDDMELASFICSDTTSFHELRNYKKYKEKFLSL